MRSLVTKKYLKFLLSTWRPHASGSLDTHNYTANCTFIRSYTPETFSPATTKNDCFLRPILYEARRYYKRTITFSVLFLFHASKQPMPQYSLSCILTPFIQFSMNCIIYFICRHTPYYSTCSKRKREISRFCCVLLLRILQHSYCLTLHIDICNSDE